MRLTLAAVIATAMCSLLYLQGVKLSQFSRKRIGLSLEQGDHGVQVSEVVPGLPGQRAGVQPLDTILQVEGVTVPDLRIFDLQAARFEPGEPVRLIVEHRGLRRELSIVPGAPFPWIPFLLSCLGVIGYTALGALALVQGAGDRRVRLLFVFSFAVALELASPSTFVGRIALTGLAISAYYLLTGLQIGVELHLASVIPDRPPWLDRRPWLVPVYYVVGLAFGIVPTSTTLLEDVLNRNVFPWSSSQSDRFFLDVGLPLWAVAVAVILTLNATRYPEPRGRHQAGLVLAGVLPWVLFVLAVTGLEQFGRPVPFWLTSLEPLVLICYPVAVFAAIFRYHLFDLELVVKRSLGYTLLTGSLILVFYAALGAGGALFSSLVEGESSSVWAISLATLVLGLLFAPMRRAVQRLIHRRFFPERHAMRQRLVALAGELPVLGKLPRMGDHLVSRLCEIFAARSAVLLLTEPHVGLVGALAACGLEGGKTALDEVVLPTSDRGFDQLRRAGRPLAASQVLVGRPSLAQQPSLTRASILVPLVRQEQLVGLLVLGPKEDGSDYRAEEMELLGLLSHHVATVLENARLFESATIESLTGLLRREAALEQLERELDRATRYHRPLTVGLADLDHFKEINDRYGHLAGDAMLKRIAKVLTEPLRTMDIVGRYGGEEFLFVLPETDMEGARAVAEKIRRRVEASQLPMDDGSSASVTISIGLASLDHSQATAGPPTGRNLIAAADRSLYQAKGAGRNQVRPLSLQIDLPTRPDTETDAP